MTPDIRERRVVLVKVTFGKNGINLPIDECRKISYGVEALDPAGFSQAINEMIAERRGPLN